MREMLEAALAHAAKRRPVFPCGPDKRPVTAHGFKDATTDPATIGTWWRDHPDALIGMPTGQASGVFVLDVDVKNGHDGEASLNELVARHGPLPATIEAFTPSGGRHLYFRLPREAQIRSSAGKLGDGLDIRGDGGYVILPPSGQNGHRYAWELSSDPDAVRAAEAPEWLIGLVAVPPAEQHQAADDAPVIVTDGTYRDLRSALAAIPADDRDTWVAIGLALKELGDRGRALWVEWSQTSDKYDPADAAHKWASFKPERTGYQAVFAEAQRRGWVNPASRSEPPPRVKMPFDPAEWLDLGELPQNLDTYKPQPRQWILKDRILRAAIGFTVSPPGVGKTAFQIATGCAVGLGQAFLGEEIIESVPVWLYTNEEDREEMLRRLLAFCVAHDIRPSSLRGRLRVSSGYGGKRLVVARRLPDGIIVQTPETDALIEAIHRTNTGLLLVDPFVSTHAVNENANTEIEEVMAAWRRVGAETNVAIDIAAHIPKSGRDPEAHAGNLDAIRGAGAAGGAARSVFTLARMNEDSAGLYGVAEEERRHLVRLDRAKGNYTPPADEATWLRMRPVCLDNDPLRPDWVGVFDSVVDLAEVAGARDADGAERDSKLRVAILSLDLRVGEHAQLSAVLPTLERLSGFGATTIRKRLPHILPEAGTAEARDAIVYWENVAPKGGGLARLKLTRNRP